MRWRGELRYDEPDGSAHQLGAYRRARRGVSTGPRTWMICARSCATWTADEPLLWLGLGSNLLVRDGGFRRHGDR